MDCVSSSSGFMLCMFWFLLMCVCITACFGLNVLEEKWVCACVSFEWCKCVYVCVCGCVCVWLTSTWWKLCVACTFYTQCTHNDACSVIQSVQKRERGWRFFPQLFLFFFFPSFSFLSEFNSHRNTFSLSLRHQTNCGQKIVSHTHSPLSLSLSSFTSAPSCRIIYRRRYWAAGAVCVCVPPTAHTSTISSQPSFPPSPLPLQWSGVYM